MQEKLKRFYELKLQQKQIEQEMDELRKAIIDSCIELAAGEIQAGDYQAKLIHQERRDYDDSRLYEALPEAEIWRLVSKADSNKISSLVKLNVISEDVLKGTFTSKTIHTLQVKKI